MTQPRTPGLVERPTATAEDSVHGGRQNRVLAQQRSTRSAATVRAVHAPRPTADLPGRVVGRRLRRPSWCQPGVGRHRTRCHRGLIAGGVPRPPDLTQPSDLRVHGARIVDDDRTCHPVRSEYGRRLMLAFKQGVAPQPTHNALACGQRIARLHNRTDRAATAKTMSTWR
jgi:hypothetical protein